jgi:hypothetical protein
MAIVRLEGLGQLKNPMTSSGGEKQYEDKKWLQLFSQDIHRLLWNPKVLYRVHKSPPLGPVMCQLNSVQSMTSNFFTGQL